MRALRKYIKGGRTKTLTLHVTEAQMNRVDLAATKSGLSRSKFIEVALVREIKRGLQP